MTERWFKIPGEQPGSRTLDEQITALRPALAGCAGKRVLDLGCAEGLIAIEFARAGAVSVLGVDSNAGHIEVARKLAPGHNVRFQRMNLSREFPAASEEFDIVLVLGILQKVEQPWELLECAADVSREWLLMRCPRGPNDGITRSKHNGASCDTRELLGGFGFKLDRIEPGAPGRAEDVEYWRRTVRSEV